MKDIGERIKAARKAKGLTQQALADALHITQGALQKWESGKNIPSVERLKQLVAILGDDAKIIPDEIISSSVATAFPEAQPVAEARRIPVVGMAAAEMFDPTLSNIHDLFNETGETIPVVDADVAGLFAIRIQGDSMAPTLLDGDIVTVRDVLPATGNICIVNHRKDGLLCKRWYWKHGIIRLESINPEGKTYQWTKEEFAEDNPFTWRFRVEAVYRKLV